MTEEEFKQAIVCSLDQRLLVAEVHRLRKQNHTLTEAIRAMMAQWDKTGMPTSSPVYKNMRAAIEGSE